MAQNDNESGGSPDMESAWQAFLTKTGLTDATFSEWYADRRYPRGAGVTFVEPGLGEDEMRYQPTPSRWIAERYEDQGRLGVGGMGEVRKVFDHRLHRNVAMKVLRSDARGGLATQRFIEEAQATSQLQHPGIVPTYELGELPDGRPFFTMKEVHGTTLDALIRCAHGLDLEDGADAPPDSATWTLPRLLEVFRRVCDAVAYAHVQGIVHRDLKPSNVMVGEFGEVLVMDWGLAKVLKPTSTAPGERVETVVVTDRSKRGALSTMAGVVVGTPAYMAPEQIACRADSVSPRMDVYALGAILYEILVGVPAFPHEDVAVLLTEKRERPAPRPMQTVHGASVPDELRQTCLQALRRIPDERPADARVLARDVGLWLEGVRRRERALRVIQDARALVPEMAQLQAMASQRRAEAKELLSGVAPWAPLDQKRAGWALQDEADALEQEAEVKELLFAQTLQTALNHDPDSTVAHRLLADHYLDRHRLAERASAMRAATRFETSLRHHDRGQHVAYLRGDGTLSLVTEPGDASVDLYRYETRDRRLTPVFVRHLGRTPLKCIGLPRGSYLLRIRRAGYDPVLYPVFLERGAHWDGVPPGETEPRPVRMLPVGRLGPDEIYVPAGWGLVGGDPDALAGMTRSWVWQDAFVMQRFPVTNADYLAFLDGLVREGKEEEALAAAPRERAGTVDQVGALIYGQREDGTFELRPDNDGDVWGLDWPTVMVDWFGALAYARWRSRRDGKSWRLPTEVEWEKAARGVDGRKFPWGGYLDPTFCCMRASHQDRWMLQSVKSFPDDEGPYGVRGMAGNVGDWCATSFVELVEVDAFGGAAAEAAAPEDLSPRVHRGGWWSGGEPTVRLATRLSSHPRVRTFFLGVRLVRSLEPDE